MSDYYYAVYVSFDCPHCHKQSTEKILAASPHPDAHENVAKEVSLLDVQCEECGKAPTNGTQIHLDVEEASEEDAARIQAVDEAEDSPNGKPN
jgi:transcription elongation factor Elf1